MKNELLPETSASMEEVSNLFEVEELEQRLENAWAGGSDPNGPGYEQPGPTNG